LPTVSPVHIVTQWSGSGGTEAYLSGQLAFFQCFDTVGWVIWPVKIVPEMTYKVSSGTLNLCSLTHSLSLSMCNSVEYPYLSADWQSAVKDQFYDEKSAEVILLVKWFYTDAVKPYVDGHICCCSEFSTYMLRQEF